MAFRGADGMSAHTSSMQNGVKPFVEAPVLLRTAGCPSLRMNTIQVVDTITNLSTCKLSSFHIWNISLNTVIHELRIWKHTTCIYYAILDSSRCWKFTEQFGAKRYTPIGEASAPFEFSDTRRRAPKESYTNWFVGLLKVWRVLPFFLRACALTCTSNGSLRETPIL